MYKHNTNLAEDSADVNEIYNLVHNSNNNIKNIHNYI